MLSRKNFLQLASAISLAPISSAVFAQGGSISFAPTSSLGAATAVPTMTDGILIALGLMLVVIALRAFQGQQASQKFLSVLILGGGLLVGGLGVDRTLATQSPVTPTENECTQGGTVALNEGFRSGNKFTNNCPAAMTITAYNLPCPGVDVVQVTPVGTSIESGVTVDINYCGPT
ncbi:MAG: hypothetical protein ACI9JM_001206 [Halioglobus sp.]|jgi:hypothetical protein